jgi:hypothetical protein
MGSAIENSRYSKKANQLIADRSRVFNRLKEIAMKRIALCFATVAALAACTSSAQASDLTEILRIAFGNNHHHRAAQQAHAQHHADLQARAVEREYVHHAAHHQPLTVRRHVRLHNDLDHSAYHDAVEHESAHATGAYYPQRYSPRYIQSYRAVPGGYGYQYGAYPYQPSPFENRVGCSPYGRY